MGILTLNQAVQHLDLESPPLSPAIPKTWQSWIAVGVAFVVGLSGCLLLKMTAMEEALFLLFFVLLAAPLILLARRVFVMKTYGHDLPDPPSLITTMLAAAFPVGVNLFVTTLFYVIDTVL